MLYSTVNVNQHISCKNVYFIFHCNRLHGPRSSGDSPTKTTHQSRIPRQHNQNPLSTSSVLQRPAYPPIVIEQTTPYRRAAPVKSSIAQRHPPPPGENMLSLSRGSPPAGVIPLRISHSPPRRCPTSSRAHAHESLVYTVVIQWARGRLHSLAELPLPLLDRAKHPQVTSHDRGEEGRGRQDPPQLSALSGESLCELLARATLCLGIDSCECKQDGRWVVCERRVDGHMHLCSLDGGYWVAAWYAGGEMKEELVL